MNLPKADADLFYKLHPNLLTYVNRRLQLATFSTVREFMAGTSLEEKSTVRNALYDNISLIDDFCTDNPCHFSDEELAIVKSWKQFVKEKFVIVKYLKQYTIFLDWNESAPKAYGVVGLRSALDEITPLSLPTMVDAVLLPFKNKIIYDGILFPYLVSFGHGYQRSMKKDYAVAKAKYGIITSLPFTANSANGD